MESRVFDTLLEPTFIINQLKKVVYCNEPAALICELTTRKILRSQMALDQIFTFSEGIQGLGDEVQTMDPTPYQEVSFKTESGKEGKAQITLQPIKVGDINEATWVVYFRDVTLEETLQKKYRAELEQKEDVIKDLERAKAELQHYSKNLESMVAKRTAELTRLNQLMAALLDSLGQGFFVFDDKGRCLEIYSKACEATVESVPADKFVWDVLKLTPQQVPGFKKWMQTIFAEMLPFEDLAPLGPKSFPHSEGKSIELNYFPLKSNEGSVGGVVVVATDVTTLVAAQKEAEVERAHAKMIVSLIRHRKQVVSFLREAESLLDDLQKEFVGKTLNMDNTFRALHTLKGGSASFSIKSIADRCHEGESLLAQYRENPSIDKHKQLKEVCMGIAPLFFHFLEENKDILGNADKMRERWIETPISHLIQLYQLPAIQSAKDIQHVLTENFLMEPVEPFFTHYNEVVQNVAEKEGKQVSELAIKNGNLKILPEPYENLFGTLVHAFRNAVDHGIETPDQRSESGKNPTGRIEVSFLREKDDKHCWFVININDDGRGIDPAIIRKKLTSMPVTAYNGKTFENESDKDIIQHIFDSQFSTKEQVTETSGRGVGMDAILVAAKNLGGTAWVESTLGKGTKLKIRVPYFEHWQEKWNTKAAA